MPAVTFTVYAIGQQIAGTSEFSVAQAFTALSLLSVLIMPVMDLTTAWSNLASAVACLDRIQAFLTQEKREDYRTLIPRSIAGSFTTRDSMLRPDDVSEKFDDAKKPVIKVRGADIGWKVDGAAIVKDVDMDIMPGELTILIGPVASGKSTLLKALLGEARLLKGSIEFTIPEEIAYCDQEAWLLNQSIKENIVAFDTMSEDFYKSVLSACQLEEDLELLPKYDDTIIGSQGVSLSGGQKQRVVSRVLGLEPDFWETTDSPQRHSRVQSTTASR